jgi:hypothetical protein
MISDEMKSKTDAERWEIIWQNLRADQRIVPLEQINRMCMKCDCLGVDCAGTESQVWTACVYRQWPI